MKTPRRQRSETHVRLRESDAKIEDRWRADWKPRRAGSCLTLPGCAFNCWVEIITAIVRKLRSSVFCFVIAKSTNNRRVGISVWGLFYSNRSESNRKWYGKHWRRFQPIIRQCVFWNSVVVFEEVGPINKLVIISSTSCQTTLCLVVEADRRL